MQCAKHPNVETNLACGKCGKPICPRCLVQTPVGVRCSECAQLKSLPTYQVSTGYYLRAVGAGIGIAIVCGFIWLGIYYIPLPFMFFLRLFIAAGVGYAIGEVVGLSVNRKRGTGLAIVSGTCAAVAFAIPNVFFTSVGLNLWGLLVLAVAIFMAVIRIR